MAIKEHDEQPQATPREIELQTRLDVLQLTELKKSSSNRQGESRTPLGSPKPEGEARRAHQAIREERREALSARR